MKNQLDEYENKIKKLIKELEEESKKHIKEINELHEYYRGYKNSSKELEERIKHYKSDCERALHVEREAKKEVVRLTLEYDEIGERAQYFEAKYSKLVRRLGASEEDLEAIEEEVGEAKQHFHNVVDVRRAKEDDVAHEISSHKKRGKSSHKKKGAKDRSESRLERRREDSYNQDDSDDDEDDMRGRHPVKDVISGE